MADYKQTSFAGGMNLLLDDTRLPVAFKYKEGETPYDISYNQYRLGLNIRTRFDVVKPIRSSVTDLLAPPGIKQAIVTFGNYIIIFVEGTAYYRLNAGTGWTQIGGFLMSKTAPRYWTVAIPVSTTNYGRMGTLGTLGSPPLVNAALPITQVNNISGTFGQTPGLLVQDGVNQPQFIYLDGNQSVQCRTTQTYNQWSYPLNPTTLELNGPDAREYVPIGTFMEWYNGILFIVDVNYTYIYRSVSGRPLDFVVNVNNLGQKGGDATTTSYSVGTSGITAMQAMPGNILFVAAGGSACYSITLNTTPNAPTIFGEYTFILSVLFNANCVTERGIVNVLGDSVFIDANGLRSFNSVEQQLNEGRNSVFSSTVQSLFTGITQSARLDNSSAQGWCSAISFDNYAIFSVNTTFGYVLVVYDTINSVYTSLDILQLGNHAAKQFAAITISTLALYAITDDDRVVQLYSSDSFDPCTIRFGAVCSQDPKKELKVTNFRPIFSEITEDTIVTSMLFTNNRLDQSQSINVNYAPPTKNYSGVPIGSDVGTQTNNMLFSFPNSAQGWKAFMTLTWGGGASLTDVALTTSDATPMNPLQNQATTNQLS